MQITINGAKKDIDNSSTIEQLLLELGLSIDQVVVELNRDILSAERFSTTQLNTGDNLELVQFVGGG